MRHVERFEKQAGLCRQEAGGDLRTEPDRTAIVCNQPLAFLIKTVHATDPTKKLAEHSVQQYPSRSADPASSTWIDQYRNQVKMRARVYIKHIQTLVNIMTYDESSFSRADFNSALPSVSVLKAAKLPSPTLATSGHPYRSHQITRYRAPTAQRDCNVITSPCTDQQRKKPQSLTAKAQALTAHRARSANAGSFASCSDSGLRSRPCTSQHFAAMRTFADNTG